MNDERPTLTLIVMYTGELLLQLSFRMEVKMKKTQEYKEKANIANRKAWGNAVYIVEFIL